MKGDLLQQGVQQRLSTKLKMKIFRRQREVELPTGISCILWVAQDREGVRRQQKVDVAEAEFTYIFLLVAEHSKVNSTGIWTLLIPFSVCYIL